MTDFKVDFTIDDQWKVEFDNDTTTINFTEDSFNVDFTDPDPFMVTFSEQGSQGPTGEDAVVRLWTATHVFREGEFARNEMDTVYISRQDNNLNNALTDADYWEAFTASGTVTFIDGRTDSDYESAFFEVAANTGLEVVMIGDRAVLQEYVAPSDFSFTLTNAQGNRSWFNTATTDTANINVTEGTVATGGPVSVTGGTASVSADLTTVTYDVGADAGSYELSVMLTGHNSDNSSTNIHHATHDWEVYRDWWFQINQPNSMHAFDASVGREASDYSNRTLSCNGHTFLTVSSDQFSGDFTFTTSLGQLTVQSPTSITVTINGVDKAYKRYYLGHFTAPTNVTTHGGT